jgi:hypothetical protein
MLIGIERFIDVGLISDDKSPCSDQVPNPRLVGSLKADTVE